MSTTEPDIQDFSGARRTLLGATVAAGAVHALGGAGLFMPSIASAAATSPDDFLQLSQFLTGGQPLDATLASRYLNALAHRDTGFGEASGALQRYLADARPASIDDLLARPDLTEPLRKTITQIVSSWYLGIVGEDADAELISYSQALMYRPTADVLVIPTYGGGPDSWGGKPA